jgi:hypothetical protein
MPSVPPTSSNDYQAPPAPAKLVLDRSVWNAVFGSVGARLRALEDVNSGIEALKLELQNFGIQRLDEAINPLIAETQAALAALQAEVAQAQDELSDTVADANAAFAAALATANASLADLQETLDQMLAGGVPAANVAVTAIDTLAATNAQAAFAEIVSEMNVLATSTTVAFATKADVSALATVKAGSAVVVSAAETMVAGGVYFAKTAAGTFTLTLPADPANGNTVTVYRYGGNAVTVARNTKTINFVADDMSIDRDRMLLQFIYLDTTWIALPGTF